MCDYQVEKSLKAKVLYLVRMDAVISRIYHKIN